VLRFRVEIFERRSLPIVVKEENMLVGEVFKTAGEIYLMGIVIAIGLAALIKLICYCIDRSEQNAKPKAQTVDAAGGDTE